MSKSTWPNPPEPKPGARRLTWPVELKAEILDIWDGLPWGSTERAELLEHYGLGSSTLSGWRRGLNGTDPEALPSEEDPDVAGEELVGGVDLAGDGDYPCVCIEFDDPQELEVLDALGFLHGQTREELLAEVFTAYLTDKATDPHVVQAIALRARWTGHVTALPKESHR